MRSSLFILTFIFSLAIATPLGDVTSKELAEHQVCNLHMLNDEALSVLSVYLFNNDL
jgi:hypothetical protein